MPNIVLSYRRADSDVIAGRIRDRLASQYGNDSIYMDIDSIPFGLDFREQIQNALLSTDILIVVIGPSWLGRDGEHARILDETDPVRIEVETALKRNIPVVPVLVGGAIMPKPADLPDSLKDLPFRNAAEVDGGRDFHQHMDRLVRSIDRVLEAKSSAVPAAQRNLAIGVRETEAKLRRRNWLIIALIIALVDTLSGVGYLATRGTSLSSIAAPTATPQAPAPPQLQALQQTNPVSSNSELIAQTMPAEAPPCNTKNSASAFHDDFKSHQLGWQPPIASDKAAEAQSFYEKGGITLAAKENTAFWDIYAALVFGDINVCARMMNPPRETKEGVVSAGVIFWLQDTTNYYMASVYLLPGALKVYRLVNKSWLLISSVPTEMVRTGPSAINQIQVVTKGNIGALYVNGKKLGEFRGQPPLKSASGIISQSGLTERATWTVIDFSASENQ